MLRQEREFRGLDELLFAIRANDLRLVEIPLVCPLVELRAILAVDVRCFRGVSERTRAC